MIVLHVRVGDAVRQIETAAQSLEDLEIPLQLWNKYFRQKVQRKFDAGGPGWPPTKRAEAKTKATPEASEDALKQAADHMLRRKLKNELTRAARKYARGKGSAAAMERRYAVLQEFERIAAGGVPAATLTADKKLEKSVHGLRERHQRATTKAAGKPLGRVASSIKSKVQKYGVMVYSEIPWSAAHNDGATVGRGAKLPQRQFLDIDEADTSILAMLIEQYVSSRA